MLSLLSKVFYFVFNTFNDFWFCADLLFTVLWKKIRGNLKDRMRIWSLPDWESELGSRQPPCVGHCQEQEKKKKKGLARVTVMTAASPASVCRWEGGLSCQDMRCWTMRKMSQRWTSSFGRSPVRYKHLEISSIHSLTPENKYLYT